MSFLQEHLSFVLISSGIIVAGIGAAAAGFARKRHEASTNTLKLKRRKRALRRRSSQRY